MWEEQGMKASGNLFIDNINSCFGYALWRFTVKRENVVILLVFKIGPTAISLESSR